MPNTLPSRASDAGPEERPLSPNERYSYAMDEADDAVRDAQRLFRDDVAIQTKLRRALIDEAIEALQRAREVA